MPSIRKIHWGFWIGQWRIEGTLSWAKALVLSALVLSAKDRAKDRAQGHGLHIHLIGKSGTICKQLK